MERLQKSDGSISKGFHMFSPAKIVAPTYEIWLYESNWLNLSKWDDFYTLMSKSHICFSISWPFFNPQTLPWSQRFFSQANSNGKPICQRKNSILQGKPFFKQYDLVQLSGFCLLPVCTPHWTKPRDVFATCFGSEKKGISTKKILEKNITHCSCITWSFCVLKKQKKWMTPQFAGNSMNKKYRVILLVETQCCLINLCPREHLRKSISQFLTFSPEENHWWFAEICPSGTNRGNYKFQIGEIILSIFFNSKPKGGGLDVDFFGPRWARKIRSLKKGFCFHEADSPGSPTGRQFFIALRIIGPSYREVWMWIAGFWDLQITCFEIPWFLGRLVGLHEFHHFFIP